MNVTLLLLHITRFRTYQNEEPWEAILYGYVVDPDSPTFLGRGDVIFEMPAGKHDDYVSISAKPTMERQVVYSDSENSASKHVAASMKIEGSYGAFSGAASMSVSSTTDSSIKTVRLDCYMRAIQMEVSSKEEFRTNPSAFLTDNFKSAVKRLPVEDIEDLIGVFYATQMDLGGEVRKSYTMQATSKDTEQSITAEVSGGVDGGLYSVSAEASFGMTTRKSNKDAAMNTEWSAKGGDAAIWLSQDIDDDDVSNTQAQWAKTIDNTNLYQFDFELKPMWDLVKAVDLKKGQEFQDYLEKKWRLQGEEFSPSMFVGEFIIIRLQKLPNHVTEYLSHRHA